MKGEEGPIVLLVDNDPEHNLALAKVLVGAGYPVHTSIGGYEALTLLKERRFDLVIMDLRMPSRVGLDLLRSIRAMNADLPVIVITAHGEWTSYVEAMNIGAVDYLTKPVRREDILSTIRGALVRRGVRPPDNPIREPEGNTGGAAA